MSNDFDDDFDSGYIDGDESFYNDEENASGGGGRSGQPFLIALLALIGVMVISAMCIMVVISSRQANTKQDDAIIAIEATNAAIQQTNIAVTVAIAATETAKSELASVQATFTPETLNSPTPDAVPTETPVVERATVDPDASEGDGSDNGEAGTDSEATKEGGDSEESTESGNGSIVVGPTATPTPISAASGGKDSTLPDTGLEVWGIALLGLVLIAILFAARRLRTN